MLKNSENYNAKFYQKSVFSPTDRKLLVEQGAYNCPKSKL